MKLAQTEAALDRDFVLLIQAEDINTPHAWADRDEHGTGAVAVAFVPAFAASSIPAEIIFLVDRSGSMEGTSIAEVRNALQLCLRSMIAGCRFNTIGRGAAVPVGVTPTPRQVAETAHIPECSGFPEHSGAFGIARFRTCHADVYSHERARIVAPTAGGAR